MGQERPVSAAWSGKDRSYKPMVKSAGVERESDGVIVLVTTGRNPVVGKDPDFGHVDREGNCKGMTGETIRSNYPGGVYAPR